MAEMQPSAAKPAMSTPNSPNGPSGQPKKKQGPPLHEIYALPAPIRTFPLPTFYPNNPISLFHLAYAWLGQILSPPQPEPAVTHEGTWSEATGSVHVTDEKSVTALWQQGFYGKGSLSRSEPEWLKRERIRRGLEESHISQMVTTQRREERLWAKWERARLEQEIIRQTREAESQQAERQRKHAKQAALASHPRHQSLSLASPVGPVEILALPNSAADLLELTQANGSVVTPLTNGAHDVFSSGGDQTQPFNGAGPPGDVSSNGRDSPANGTPVIPGLHKLRERKNVRFSPKVESTTFGVSDPPSPNQSATTQETPGTPIINGHDQVLSSGSPTPITIVNKEHLQLMPEEALWLSFGLGALAVKDPLSGNRLSTQELLTLFRQHCYFPPRTGPDDPTLQPDDDFLVQYAVYHHFRSLGWVPRAGIKFGVDWLLYTRGPVFDHAQFGLVVIPSYSDPWWKESGKKSPGKTWYWLHNILRVLSHVLKSMVLVYVDVPPPPRFEESLETGFAEALKLYKVREIMVKRWSSNRNR